MIEISKICKVYNIIFSFNCLFWEDNLLKLVLLLIIIIYIIYNIDLFGDICKGMYGCFLFNVVKI